MIIQDASESADWTNGKIDNVKVMKAILVVTQALEQTALHSLPTHNFQMMVRVWVAHCYPNLDKTTGALNEDMFLIDSGERAHMAASQIAADMGGSAVYKQAVQKEVKVAIGKRPPMKPVLQHSSARHVAKRQTSNAIVRENDA